MDHTKHEKQNKEERNDWVTDYSNRNCALFARIQKSKVRPVSKSHT